VSAGEVMFERIVVANNDYSPRLQVECCCRVANALLQGPYLVGRDLSLIKITWWRCGS